jgi:hypothetical protein
LISLQIRIALSLMFKKFRAAFEQSTFRILRWRFFSMAECGDVALVCGFSPVIKNPGLAAGAVRRKD